jgi:hypothetical protein
MSKDTELIIKLRRMKDKAMAPNTKDAIDYIINELQREQEEEDNDDEVEEHLNSHYLDIADKDIQ